MRLVPVALVMGIFCGGLQLNGQEEPPAQPESEYTEDQVQAIDRVDKLSELLLGMPWNAVVVNTLSALGGAACRHDKALGIRVFEKAYSVAAGLNLDLDEESSVDVLSTLVSRASRCHPGFGVRSPTGREDLPRLQPLARLASTLDTLRTNPAATAGFAHDVAESFSDLDTWGQQSFVSALTDLRQQRASEADAVFQDALRRVASSGSVTDLFALGNYVFGPGETGLEFDALRVIPVSEGSIFVLKETRAGIPDELANLYIASSSAVLARQTALALDDTLAFGLTKQLEAWAKSHAPHQVPTLTSLLGNQRATLAQTQGFPRLERALGEEPASALDQPPMDRLRFYRVGAEIHRGDLEEARELVAELEDEVRPPLLDIIALKEVRRTIGEGDLEAARLGLSTLNDKLHLVLASLSLASAHWNLLDESGNRLDKEAQAAVDAIQLAASATAQVPDHIRPQIRVAIAGALALTQRFEESLVALELALQEINAAPKGERSPDGPLSVGVSDGGRVNATVIRDNLSMPFSLLPLRGRISNFAGTVLQLSKSPESDLDRLEGLVTRVVNPRLRTSGLLAIAEGALSKAFLSVREPLTEPENRDERSQDTPGSPETDDQALPD